MAKKNTLDRGSDVGLDDNSKAKKSNAVDVALPVYTTARDVAKPTYQANTMAYPTYSPSYAQYSYGKAAPTWNWNQAAPTWQWDDTVRPGDWKWDDSARPGDFTYKDAPTYNNQYQDQINQMVYDILNRPAFSYNKDEDPLYQQYAEVYTRNGQQAMNDTLAQMAARTGGLASSYAGTASQQTYNKYMDALNDKVPELYQLAYNMYNNEGNNMRTNLSMVQGLENTDYGRYLDQLGQYNTDRSLAYNQYMNNWNQYNTDRNLSYNQYQDEWDRYYNDRNFSYGQYQDQLGQYNTDRNFSYGQYQDALGQWNTDRNWDYNLWSDNQSRQEAARKAAYQSQVAAYNAEQSRVNAYNNAQTAAYQAALKAEQDRVKNYNNAQDAAYQAALRAAMSGNGNTGGADNTANTGNSGNTQSAANQYDNDPKATIQAFRNAGGDNVVTFLGSTYNLSQQTGKNSLSDLIGRINTMPFSAAKKQQLMNELQKYGI